MKKISMLVCAILACGCMAFADEPKYYCPSGTKAYAPSNETEYKYSNTTTFHSGNCESTSTQKESGQNHTVIGGNIDANTKGGILTAIGAGANAAYTRDGEKTTTTTSTSQCNETTVRYICK